MFSADMARIYLDVSPRKRTRGIVINKREGTLSKKRKKAPPKGGKVKHKEPLSEVPEHNSGSKGESFDSTLHSLSLRMTGLCNPYIRRFKKFIYAFDPPLMYPTLF